MYMYSNRHTGVHMCSYEHSPAGDLLKGECSHMYSHPKVPMKHALGVSIVTSALGLNTAFTLYSAPQDP